MSNSSEPRSYEAECNGRRFEVSNHGPDDPYGHPKGWSVREATRQDVWGQWYVDVGSGYRSLNEAKMAIKQEAMR